MSEITETPRKGRPRYRLLRNSIIAVGSLALLLALAWLLLEQYLRIDSYRPALEAKIEAATGLPATIGELDLALSPTPVITADGVTLGEGDLALRAQNVTLHPDMQALMRKAIRVTRMDLTQLSVRVPQQPARLKQQFQAIADRMGKNKGGSIRFDVDRILAEGAHLFLGDAKTPIFTGNLDARNVLSREPSVVLNAAAIALKDRVDAQGRVRIRRGPPERGGIEFIRGDFDLDGLNLARIVDRQKVPRVTIGLEGQFGGQNPSDIAISLDGKVEPAPNAENLGESLEGPFTGRAKWDGSAFRVEDIRWDALGLRLNGDFAVTPEGAYAIRIPRALVGALTLNPIFAWETSQAFNLEAAKGGQVEITDFTVRASSREEINLDGGRVAFKGLNFADGKGKDIIKNVGGVVVLGEGELRVEELTAPNARLKGTVKPDFKARTVGLDFSGDLQVDRALLARFMPVDRLREATGKLDVKRLAGTFGGAGVPEDLVAEGTLSDGRVALNLQELKDTITGITADFTARPNVIELAAKAQSASMGPLETKGAYTLDARTWKGTLTANVASTAAPFLRTARLKEVVPPLLTPYGTSTFDATLTLPTDKEVGLVHLVRQGEPALTGAVQLIRRKSGTAGGDIEATATLPLTPETTAPLLPPNTQASGNAAITFAQDVSKKVFAAHIDLTGATVDYGPYLHKREGTDATVDVAGTVGDKWSAQTLDAVVAGQPVRGQWHNDRLVFADLDLDMDRLSALFPKGTSATGRVTGTAATGPTEAEMVLHDVAFTYKPGVAVDSASGTVVYADNRLALKDLTVRGAKSEATMTLVREGQAWRGNVVAQRLDVNAINELREAARGDSSDDSTEQVAAQDNGDRRMPFEGQLDLRIAQLAYRRAEIPGVQATVSGDGRVIAIQELTAQPAEGTLTGAINLTRRADDGVYVVRGNLALQGVDAQVIDELAFAESRGFKGAMTGQLTFDVPILPKANPVNGTTGHAEIEAKNGTFGKLGIATKILNVMRTTEIFRLRLPSIRDEGLTYDTANFAMDMKNGVMQIERFQMRRPSFALEADGVVNFPRDEMNVEVDVHPFQTVTGLVEKVPLVGQAARALQKAAPLGIVAQGSPYDPSVRPEALSGGGPSQSELSEVVEGDAAPEPDSAEAAVGTEADAVDTQATQTASDEAGLQNETEQPSPAADEGASDSATEEPEEKERASRGLLRRSARGLADTLRGL